MVVYNRQNEQMLEGQASRQTEIDSLRQVERERQAQKSRRRLRLVAAAALYVSALINGEKRTQREVADVAGVTEVTIRNRYKEILEELGLERELKKAQDKAAMATKK